MNLQNDQYDNLFPNVNTSDPTQYNNVFGTFHENSSLLHLNNQRNFQNASANQIVQHQQQRRQQLQQQQRPLQQQPGFFTNKSAIINGAAHSLMGPPESPTPLTRFFRDPYQSWSPVRHAASSSVPAKSTFDNQSHTDVSSSTIAQGSAMIRAPKAVSDSGHFSSRRLNPSQNAGNINTNVRQRGGSFSGNSATWKSADGHLRPPEASPTSPDETNIKPRNMKRKLRDSDPEGSIMCEQANCGVVSRTQSQYRKHVLQHERPYKCNFEKCVKRVEGFPTKNDRSRHEASVHHIFEGGMKAFVCRVPDCGQRHKLWPRQDNFDNHVQKLHNLEKGVGNNDKKRQEFIKRSTVTVPPDGWDLSGVIKNLDINSLLVNENPFPIRDPDYNQPVPKIILDHLDEVSNAYDARSTSDVDPQFQTMSFGESAAPYSCQSDISGDELTSQPNQYEPGWISGSTSLGMDMDVDGPGFDMGFSTSPLIPANALKPSKEMQSQEVSLAGGDLGGPKSPPSAMIHLNSNSPSHRSKSVLRELAQRLANEAEASRQQNAPPKDLAEEIFKILQAGLPMLRECGRARLRGSSQRVPSSAAMIPKFDEMSRNGSPSTGLSRQSHPEYTCNKCEKRFKSNAKRRKHQRRHEKLYGCTFERCRQFFGSKSDWKRHENSMHFPKDVWLCNLPTVCQSLANMSHNDIMRLQEHPLKQPSNYCGHKAHQQDRFESHLKEYHHLSEQSTIDALTKRQHIGANHQGSFWCGFCYCPIKLEKQRENAWEERFNHIEKHFTVDKKSASQWVPPGATMTKQELLQQRAVKSDDSSLEESEDSEDDMGDAEPDPLAEPSQPEQPNFTRVESNHVNNKPGSGRKAQVYCNDCGDGPFSPEFALNQCFKTGCPGTFVTFLNS